MECAMAGIGEQVADIAAINSELRYITLELMKISAEQKKPFEQVLAEFTGNTFKLKRALIRSPRDSQRRAKQRG
jgi:hypothetical protein